MGSGCWRSRGHGDSDDRATATAPMLSWWLWCRGEGGVKHGVTATLVVERWHRWPQRCHGGIRVMATAAAMARAD
eukprot:8685165-Alexandrium_andersonii.AAC.1